MGGASCLSGGKRDPDVSTFEAFRHKFVGDEIESCEMKLSIVDRSLLLTSINSSLFDRRLLYDDTVTLRAAFDNAT